MDKKNVILGLVIILGCAVCQSASALPEVSFEWFNLSTNEIYVTEVIGLPPEASGGRLIPNHAEDQLERSESTFSETIKVGSQIKIEWNDNGTNGFHRYVMHPETGFPGVAHQAEFKRDDLGIPSKIKSGKVRLTYLGSDKWRVKFFPQ